MKRGGFKTIPRVRAYLLDIKIFDYLEEVVAKYELPQKRLDEFLALTTAVINGVIKIDQVPEFIEKAFGVDAEKAKLIAADIVGYRLLPLSVFIEGVERSIEDWGGTVSDYPDFRIQKPGVEDELLEYVAEIGLELPENLMKRFIYLSKGYIKDERDREATATMMKRPMNIGGLDLKEDQIESLLATLDKRFKEASELEKEPEEPKEAVESSESQKQPEKVLPKVEIEEVKEVAKAVETKQPRIESKPEKATRNREMLPMKAVPHALTTDVPVISGHLLEHEQAEIDLHTKTLEKQGIVKNDESAKLLNETIQDALQKILPIFKEVKQSQKSANTIVESFVRGRLGEQRADALLQDKYSMSAEQSHKVIAILKDGFSKVHKVPITKPVITKSDVVAQEKKVLDERHAAITSSMPKESIEPIMPSARVSAARSKQEEVQGQQDKVDKDRVKQAQVKARPEKVKVRLSKDSIPPKQQVEVARKMADVKKVSRLVGPIEELGTMNIVEFRRLSSDPNEALVKIINTLDLLEETDYEERIKGIVAWRKSPVNKLYVSIVQDALTDGMTVADAAAQKRNAGEESLSTAEIDAIVKLNRKLSF